MKPNSPTLAQPCWFISHGAPNVVLIEDRYTETLRHLAQTLPARPKAIVILSAHGESESAAVQVTTDAKHALEYDFRGFQPEMYQMTYSCPGAPELAAQVAQRISRAGFPVELVQGRRLDHGVWVPLKLIFPDASIPVIQIFLPSEARTPEGQYEAQFLRVGRALSEMRREGVLLIGSGGAVHNLNRLQWSGKEGPPAEWAVAFEAWLRAQLEARDVGAIAHFREQGPEVALAHPTVEHFMPLLFALGATLPGDVLDWIHEGFQYGTLSMLCVGFQGPGLPAGSNLPN